MSASPLRILMTTDAVGGVWTFSTRLARELSAEGCEVNLVTLGPSPNEQQMKAIAGCPRVTLTITDLALEWADHRGSDAARARQVLAGIAHLFQPDVIHCNGYREALSPFAAPVLITAHSCVRSWWLACHGSVPPRAEWAAYMDAVETALDSAACWVAPTETHCRLVQELYCPATAGRTVWNGTAATGGGDDKEPFVLAAGRLWDRAKGIATLATAASDVEWPVKVAGSVATLSESAPEGLHDQVEWLGDLPHGELLAMMTKAGIFVAPSLYEPFGLSVLEAAGAGCALVLADIPTFRELWDGVALFVDPRDSAALADTVNKLCRDDALRTSCQSTARARARRYPLQATANAYLAIYREIGTASSRPHPAAFVEVRS